MRTLTTNGITVGVETQYQPQQSDPLQRQYVFAYRITIENRSPYTVQLLRRHWYIFDSNSQKHEVEGEGVVGKKPTLAPGQQHQYVSWCQLTTDIGSMKGTFQMIRSEDDVLFDVIIPEFVLTVPDRQN